MTVPGVGPIIAIRFAAVIDVVLGLTPAENSSSERTPSHSEKALPELDQAIVRAS